jgi:hypothetical protein
MLFHVTRTGIDDGQPCDEAFLRDIIRVDERTAGDPALIPAYKNSPEKWYTDGTNHRVENGHIKRDFVVSEWCVEIDSLQELLAFVSRNGQIVFGPSYLNNGMTRIEIYDDYRE